MQELCRLINFDGEKQMKKEYVMGNGAIALGALSAGVNLVTG